MSDRSSARSPGADPVPGGAGPVPGGADPAQGGVVCVVLAAGSGERFGGPKQLARLDGRPLLEHVVAAAVAAPSVDRVLVVLGARIERIEREAQLAPARVVPAPDWRDGPGASLRAGLTAARAAGAETVVLLLGDQPGVRPASIERCLAVPGPLVRSVYDGRPGHPVILRGDAIAQISGLSDAERRAHLRELAVPVETADLGGGADVDAPADLERLRRTWPPRPDATPEPPSRRG